MLDHLHDRHHQPRRRSLLGHQSAEIDRLRLHGIERAIDGAEQHAPAGGIGRRIGKAQALAHAVMQLRRVQPHMGMGEAEIVRDETRPDHQQGAFLCLIRRCERRREQGQQRLGRGQRLIMPADERLAEGADRSGIGAIGRGGDLVLHGGDGGLHPFEDAPWRWARAASCAATRSNW